MRITSLQIMDTMRIRCIDITPPEHVVEISGTNKQGKSSAINCVQFLFGGKLCMPPVPVRTGAKQSVIVGQTDADEALDLPPLTFTRTTTASKSELVITTETGFEMPSPQTLATKLWPKRAWNPMDFLNATAKEQVNQLRDLIGLDFTAQDQERARLFDERSDVNREAKRLTGHAAELGPVVAGLADAVSVEELMGELGEIDDHNKTVGRLVSEQQTAEAQVADADSRVKEAERQLETAKEAADQAAEVFWAAGTAMREAGDKLDPDPVKARIADNESNLAAHRANDERKRTSASLETSTADSSQLTEAIENIDAAKERAMADAAWPVDGLGFDDNGVTLNGLPIEQGSQAETIGVAIGIGMGLRPTLSVLLFRDASLLDDDSWQAVTDIAVKNDYQIFLETVGKGHGDAIVLEDGEVKGGGER